MLTAEQKQNERLEALSSLSERATTTDSHDTLAFVKQWAHNLGCVCSQGDHVDRGFWGIEFVDHDPTCPVKLAAIAWLESARAGASSARDGCGDTKLMMRLANEELTRLADPDAQPVVDIGPDHFEVTIYAHGDLRSTT